jgi:hypothetical protein
MGRAGSVMWHRWEWRQRRRLSLLRLDRCRLLLGCGLLRGYRLRKNRDGKSREEKTDPLHVLYSPFKQLKG